MKKFFSLLLCCVLILSIALPASAAKSEAQTAAEKLHALGLLSGMGTLPDGSVDFGLDEPLSREQGVTMLLRLMGLKSDGAEYPMPFSDVSPWASKAVAYAHSLGLAKGYSDTLFGGRDSLSAAGYLSFVLRALGYSSDTDFSWRSPWTLSDAIGLTHSEYNEHSGAFTRGDMALISLRALDIPTKNGGSLLDKTDSSETQTAAEKLHSLGLLSGMGTLPDGSVDFGLDKPLSREQGVTMLLRLMAADIDGAEHPMPFSDVSPWASKAVAYAYSLGLAKGYSDTLFGGRDPLSAAGYLSFVLRALGYSSDTDFSWRSPWTLSDAIGLTHGEYSEHSGAFTRGDMALISLRALGIPTKDGGSLLDKPSPALPEDPEKAARTEAKWQNLKNSLPDFGHVEFFGAEPERGKLEGLLSADLDALAEAIESPGELLGYLALSDFNLVAGSWVFSDSGLSWQLPESALCAHKGRAGSSAALAALACSLLADDAEEAGSVTFSHPAVMGGGHSLSYLLIDGLYYVFDLSAAVESGFSDFGAICCGPDLGDTARRWLEESGSYAQHMFSTPGAPLPWACEREELFLSAEHEDRVSILYEDTDWGCSHQFVSMSKALSAELELLAAPIPAPGAEKGSLYERRLSDEELKALKYADKYSLREHISSLPDAAAWLDSFVWEFSALDKGLNMDIDYLLSLHRLGYTAPETYSAFAFWCLGDDVPEIELLLASAESPQGPRLYTSLLLPSGGSWDIVNPATFSAHPNPVYGFREKSVTDFENASADFVPRHDWVDEDSTFELYNILRVSPAPERGSFRFEGSYLLGESWAEEVYRK